jgi:hypothetical protein
MTVFRLISLPTHGAAEMALGTAVLAAPLLLGLGPAAIVVAFLLGAMLVGVSLAAVADDSLSIATHSAFDIALVAALAAGALLVGLAGERAAALLLLGAAAVELGLLLTTRWSRVR